MPLFFKNLNRKNVLQKKDLTMRQVLSVVKPPLVPSWKQWKQLPHMLSLTEKRFVTGALILFLACLLIWAGRFLFAHRVDVPTVGGEYTEGLVGEPRFINPLYATTNDVDRDLSALIYSGLLKFDPDEGYVPDLAQSVQISDDGLSYTLRINDHAKFHNGESVRARDVLFTVSAIQNPNYHSPLADQFHDVTVAQVDDTTVSFVLKEPRANFLQYLTIGILPASLWAEILPQHAPLAALNLQPVGSGPYQFSEFTKDKRGSIRSYSLKRNADYYAPKALIETLTFKFYPDARALLEGLENKNIEGMGVVEYEQYKTVADNAIVDLMTPWMPQETVLYFNQTLSSALADATVRSAIAQAISKEKIVQDLFPEQARVIHGPILQDTVGFHETLTDVFDAAKANTILDEAGYTRVEGGNERLLKESLRKKTESTEEQAATETQKENVLSLTLTALDQEDMRGVAQRIQEDLSLIGVNMSLTFVNEEQMLTQIIEPRNFQLLLVNMILEGDSDPYSLWHSSQTKSGGLNLADYKNADADKLLEEGRKEKDVTLRAQKYQQFQELLAKDIPAVFLYQSRFAHAIAKKVHASPLSRIVTPSDRFSQVTHWYIKTKKTLE